MYKKYILSISLLCFAIQIPVVLSFTTENICRSKKPHMRISRSISSSRIMSSTNSWSVESLGNYAQDLIQRNLEKDETNRTSICISVAGGGGNAISTLAATSGASQLLLEGDVLYSRKSYLSYVGLPSNTTGFHYTSLEAAKMASEAALTRALTFRTDSVRRMHACIGVGCASSLTSESSSDDQARAFIVATRVDGSQLKLNLNLASSKTRLQQDVCVSYWILRAIELIQKESIEESDVQLPETDGSITAQWTTKRDSQDEGIAAAKRILDGNETAVVLVPIYENGQVTSFRALGAPTLPNDCIIFPGSYNPPHRGHIGLAHAALVRENQRKRSSRNDNKAIFFELSIANADKPSIDPVTVSQRLNEFLTLDDLPDHFGVILTKAPLFSQKASCLQKFINSFDGSDPCLSFVIGTDTLVRLIDPKYYLNSEEEMIKALSSMTGVTFLVGGRLEQRKDSKRPRFVSGSEEIKDLPEEVKGMFTIINEEDFRIDISSSEIRQKKEEKVTNS